MDIVAARTFLEIVKTGSFVRAAASLNVTQTTVSARIRVLEEQLDRQLFVRNKAGAKLTSAGDQFLRYATTLVQVWETALHQVAMPAGRETSIACGIRCSSTGWCGCEAIAPTSPFGRRSMSPIA
jgi:DNA-binding transcriptional LysR family regulator